MLLLTAPHSVRHHQPSGKGSGGIARLTADAVVEQAARLAERDVALGRREGDAVPLQAVLVPLIDDGRVGNAVARLELGGCGNGGCRGGGEEEADGRDSDGGDGELHCGCLGLGVMEEGLGDEVGLERGLNELLMWM